MWRAVRDLAIAAILFYVGSAYLCETDEEVGYLAILISVPILLSITDAFQKDLARRNGQGWSQLTPSATHWLGLAGSATMALILLYVFLLVRSLRYDAERQNEILFWLMVAFSAGASIMLCICFLISIRWNDECLEYWFGPWLKVRFSWGELEGAEHHGIMGVVRVYAIDGRRLSFDPTMNGADELSELIFSKTPGSVVRLQ